MRENLRRDFGSRSAYSPINLVEEHTDEEIRAEYKRMRENLRRNVRRIVRSGEFDDVEIIKELDRFEPVSDLSDRSTDDMAFKLAELESIMSSNRSTLTGLRRERREAIETLRDEGYTGINKSNYLDFYKFLESTRSLTTTILQYSYDKYGRAVGADRNKRKELFNTAVKKGISVNSLIRDFRFYVDHADELKELPDRDPGRRKLGSKSIRRMLEESL